VAQAYRAPEATTVTAQIARITTSTPLLLRWWIGFLFSCALVLLFLASVAWLFWAGVGVWGINIPVNWGIAISNTVWWIGLGHAGTFISAMLLLMQQDWRNSLNRFAEAMTLFAATCAALYPVLHLGRPFFFYWMAPYPNPMALWPQFRSPLVWDFFAISVYVLVSFIFWYIGIVPDLATVRDRAKDRWGRTFYGLLCLGWRGSARHWALWRRTYLYIAFLAMPLVVSVHSGVSMLFAAGPIAGWHTTIFPPYFVIGAVFSGFAVVIMIGIVLRRAFALANLVTAQHLDNLARWLLITGLLTAYGYIFEAFNAWYSGDAFERQTLMDRLTGPFALSYWTAVGLNFIPLQLMWSRRLRRNLVVLFTVALAVAVGMWFERYMLVVSTLSQDYLPAMYGPYVASFWEWTLFAGLVGLFLFLFFLFVRFMPLISIFEVREVMEERKPS
jgi:molybdopterin-containing oxidoreductase family membrane subunit